MRILRQNIPAEKSNTQIIHIRYSLKRAFVDNYVENVDNFVLNTHVRGACMVNDAINDRKGKNMQRKMQGNMFASCKVHKWGGVRIACKGMSLNFRGEETPWN